MMNWLPRKIALVGLLGFTTACSVADPSRHIETFDFIWETLDERYPFFGRKNIDWAEVGKQYRSALAAADRPHEFYHLLAGLLSELDDEHVRLEISRTSWIENDVAPTRFDRRDGLGLISIGARIHVAEWPAGDAPIPPDHLDAAEASLPVIERAEGHRLVGSLASVLFTGPAGSPIELQLRWRDGTVSRHLTHRPTQDEVNKRGSESIELDFPLTEDHAPRLRIAHLSPSKSRRKRFLADIDRQIDAAAEKGRGLIIDLRGNGGGYLSVMTHIGGRFLEQPYTFVIDVPDETWLAGLITVQTFLSHVFQPRAPRFDGPLVVLVDADTGSVAEHLAQVLQRAGGATVVGEPTAGASAMLRKFDTPDGSTLVFGAVDMFDARGLTLQDVGVRPDVVVLRRLEDYARLGWRAARAQWERRVLTAAQAAIARQPLVRSR